MRPTVRKAIIGVAAVVILFACADENSETPDGADPAGATSEQAFPVTIETAFEAVTIEEPPRRIVALGWGDAEVVLALGGQPVGASDWLEFGGDGVGPWSEGLYEQSPELIDTLEPSYEAVAALEPDLILDVKGSGDQQRYDLLSGIATTIGIPEGGADYMKIGRAHV